jgi:DNA-binding FadR family transcriptional regulator
LIGAKLAQTGAKDQTSNAATKAAPDELPIASGAGAAAIATRLREAILGGHYTDGERLPAERELTEHFGAARGTVREALRRLEEMGLVTRRMGSGTFVNHRAGPDEGDIAELTSPVELIDVRLAIEPDVARMAVANGTARDLERLEAALVECEAAGGDREAFSQADERFHRALAEATRNPLMIWLYGKINDVRGHTQWNAMKGKILTEARISAYNAQHRKLFEAVRSRDMDAAVQSIENHLGEARKDLLGVRGR